MRGPASGSNAGRMIIDPQSFVVLEMDRHLAAARAAQAAQAARAPRAEIAARRRRPGRHRGLRLRLAAWATGRTAHV
ncbi:MAG: hypothetical protein JWR55_2123 [Aeromicrobium sp.]|jgi:hypothetical protein|nr:hypothetical protein [Aeromicrobium sp.]